jgi:hypothetical protein
MARNQIMRRSAITGALLFIAACTGDMLAPSNHFNESQVAASRGRDQLPGAGSNGYAYGKTSGNATGSANGASANAANAESPKPVSCRGRQVIQSSGKFGPGGGILVFGNSSLVIPGGALRDTVTISATQADDGTSTVRFEPHGLRFYKPAGLVLDGSGCALPSDGVPSVVYLDDAGQVLETIPAYYDPHWKTVAAPIEHFSGYAIAFRDAR